MDLYRGVIRPGLLGPFHLYIRHCVTHWWPFFPIWKLNWGLTWDLTWNESVFLPFPVPAMTVSHLKSYGIRKISILIDLFTSGSISNKSCPVCLFHHNMLYCCKKDRPSSYNAVNHTMHGKPILTAFYRDHTACNWRHWYNAKPSNTLASMYLYMKCLHEWLTCRVYGIFA